MGGKGRGTTSHTVSEGEGQVRAGVRSVWLTDCMSHVLGGLWEGEWRGARDHRPHHTAYVVSGKCSRAGEVGKAAPNHVMRGGGGV